jgi:hypothetical protein
MVETSQRAAETGFRCRMQSVAETMAATAKT